MEVATEEVVQDASLEELQKLLDDAPPAPHDAEENDAADDIPADEADDAGTEEEAAEAEPEPEGPSAVLRTLARQAGLRPSLVALAKDDAQLQAMIDEAMEAKDSAEPEKPEEKPQVQEPEPDFFASEFGEDEFDETDPAHRVIKGLVTKLNEYDKRQAQRDALFAQFAKQQLEREDARKQAEDRQIAEKLYKPLDAALDDYGHEVFGDSKKGLSKSQIEARREVAVRYVALGIKPDDSDTNKDHIADLAIRAFSKEIAESRDKKQKQLQRQSRERTGGGGKIDPAPGQRSREESLDVFDDYLRGIRPGVD